MTAFSSYPTIGPKCIDASCDSDALLREAFSANSDFETAMVEAEKDDQPVLIIVNDSHRSTRTRETLLAIAQWLNERKMSRRFRLLVATGTHVIADDEKQAFERDTFSDTGLTLKEIQWHDSRDDGYLVAFKDWHIHPWLAQSTTIIAIGSVEPHYFAGLTGAHKTVTIGCMGMADIQQNHAHALSPHSDVLRLDGNPVFDGAAKVVRALQNAGKRIVAVNQIVCGEHILFVAVGDPIDTLYELLPKVEEIYVHKLDAPVDCLELRVPLPLGRSMYQADKALKNNHLAVRDGGGIILDAPCPDSIGDDAFINLLRRCESYAQAVLTVEQDGYKLGDHKAVKLRHLTDPKSRGVRVAIVTHHISDGDAQVLGMRRFDDVSSARAWLAEVVNPADKYLAIEDAGFVTAAVV